MELRCTHAEIEDSRNYARRPTPTNASGTKDLEEAEQILRKRIDDIRRVAVHGERPIVTFGSAVRSTSDLDGCLSCLGHHRCSEWFRHH
jgi:hypothetical protein